MKSSLRHLPNLISAARIVLVLPIIWCLLNREFTLAIWLFLIAGASDGLDGFLAKRFGWSSRLGGILDALADKFLLLSTFICLWWLGVFPWWLVLSILARDLVIVIGATVYNFRIEAVQPGAEHGQQAQYLSADRAGRGRCARVWGSMPCPTGWCRH